MEILQAGALDLVEILYLVKECIKRMNENGEMHWNTASPSPESIIQDIEKKNIYLAKEKGVCRGMVCVSEEAANEYKDIKWDNNSSGVLYIKYYIIHPVWQGKGVDKLIIDFIEKYAKENKYTNIRVNAFQNNRIKNDFLTKEEFEKKGDCFIQYQKTPFVCFEKKV